MKTCNTCNEEKSFDAFHKQAKAPDRHNYICKTCSSAVTTKWYKQNSKRHNELSKKYHVENKDYYDNYRKNNKVRKRENHKKQLQNNINVKLACSLRTRLWQAIKANQKSGSAVKDLGCTIEQLKVHLESKFISGMTWQNQGKWHIDHIIPLSKFNLSNRKELLKAVHYTNLQPLWATDNFHKSNKI